MLDLWIAIHPGKDCEKFIWNGKFGCEEDAEINIGINAFENLDDLKEKTRYLGHSGFKYMRLSSMGKALTR